MKALLKLQPSLWLTVVLLTLGAMGGVASLAIQGRQSHDHLEAAAAEMTGGDPHRGHDVVAKAACGACHQIPGVPRADGTVGPSLRNIATRAFIAGRLANTPDNLIGWVRHPQAVETGNGMPDPPITDQEARDVAAYLYTLK